MQIIHRYEETTFQSELLSLTFYETITLSKGIKI